MQRLPLITLAVLLAAAATATSAELEFHLFETEDMLVVYLDEDNRYILPHLGRCFTNSLEKLRAESAMPLTHPQFKAAAVQAAPAFLDLDASLDKALDRFDRYRHADGDVPTAELRLEMQKTMQRDAAVFRESSTLEHGLKEMTDIAGKIGERLREHEETALLCRRLIGLRTDLDLGINLNELRYFPEDGIPEDDMPADEIFERDLQAIGEDE